MKGWQLSGAAVLVVVVAAAAEAATAAAAAEPIQSMAQVNVFSFQRAFRELLEEHPASAGLSAHFGKTPQPFPRSLKAFLLLSHDCLIKVRRLHIPLLLHKFLRTSRLS
jgi:hypothetical protein